jgi:hypothetical protein
MIKENLDHHYPLLNSMSRKEKEISSTQIKKWNSIIKNIQNHYKDNKEVILDYPEQKFIQYCYNIKSQQYGIAYENCIRKQYELNKVSPKLKRGDSEKNGIYYENKVSYLSNGEYYFVQLRLLHNIDKYILIAIDTSKSNFKKYIFCLSSKEMRIFCDTYGAASAHGKSSDSKDPETRISVIKDSPAWSTLLQYKTTLKEIFG